MISDYSLTKSKCQATAVAGPVPHTGVVTDDEFLDAFSSGRLANEAFHHRDHLRLTWLLLHRLGSEAGAEAVAGGIRRFAAAHGHQSRYHETMTRFWIRLVDHTMRARPVTSFEELIQAFPMLLDKHLPFNHWNRETIMSDAARREFVEPDLLALPAA